MHSKIATKAIIACVLLVFVTVSNAYSTSEKGALIELYNSLHGAFWDYRVTNCGPAGSGTAVWLSTDDPCAWCGIGCGAGGEVTSIYMSNFNVSGTIPPSIGTFTSLSSFNIDSDNGGANGYLGNKVVGSLPLELLYNTKIYVEGSTLGLKNNYFQFVPGEYWLKFENARPSFCTCDKFIGAGGWNTSADGETLQSLCIQSSPSSKCPTCLIWEAQCNSPSCPTGAYNTTRTPALCFPNCGNNRWDAGEQCDNGAHCTASCTCEPGYEATTPASKNCQIGLSVSPLSTTNTSCPSSSDGTASVNVTGGTTPYTFQWSKGSSTVSIATGLSSGDVSVNVTDLNGHWQVVTLHVGSPNAIVVTASTTQQVSCNLGSNGAVSATAYGGAGGFTYSWSTTPAQAGSTLSGLSAATYTVTATDANGCSNTDSTEITEPGALIASVSSSNDPSCKSGSDGDATAGASGGTPTYSYLWSTGATSAYISGLSAGVYSGTVTDGNGCTDDFSVTIGEPLTSVSVTASQSSAVACNGEQNGVATASGSGGTGAITYSWSPSGGNSDTASGLSAGTYTVTATDANGCWDDDTVEITEPAILYVIPYQTKAVACHGESTGEAEAYAVGGVAAYTFSWDQSKSGDAVTGVSADSTFEVTVTDGNGCTATNSTIIEQPSAALAITATPTDVVCYGGSTGSVSASVTGGTGAYTYTWASSASTDSSRSSLAYGSYTVEVTDENGCTDSDTVTVDQPGELTSTGSKHNVGIAGESTGWAEVVVSGGVGPYTYVWDGAASAETTDRAENLPVGNYTIVVTDTKGCTVSRTFVIGEPSALTIDSTIQHNVLCYNEDSGSAHITYSGGVSPYTVSWTGSASTSADATNLYAGSYIVTVTDANSASATYDFQITSPNDIVVSTDSQTNIDCRGESTGSATLSATGGNGTISFQWGVGGATGATVGSLSAGTITVTATDGNGCSKTHDVVITQPATSVSATASVTTHVSCFGASTGVLSGGASGGVGPYSWSWNTGAYSSQSPSAVPAGDYTLVATDNNGCSATSSTVTISQPTSLPSSSPSETQSVLCYGGSTGSADANAVGGTGALTVVWKSAGTTIHTGQSASGLAAGTYTIDVTDANSCSATQQSVAITEPAAALDANIGAPTHVQCKGDATGSVTVTYSGGTGSKSVLWSNSATSDTISTINAGSYTVTVTDANGCSVVRGTSINEPATGLSATTTPTDASCNGGSTGSVNLNVAGGTGSKTYLWSNGATVGSLNSVAAGSYDVTVTDANGCTFSTTPVTVGEPAAIVVTVVSTNTTYTAAADGSATASATGGSGSFPSWSWSPSGGSSNSASGLTAGSYTVSTTDSNGCPGNKVVTIYDPICTPSCINTGLCRAPGTCDCSGTDHFGSYCQTPYCGDGTLNNGEECDGGSGCFACECQAGWAPSGTTTCTPICDTPCQHGGVCVAPNSCDCDPATPADGWVGNACEIPVCDPACLHGGNCTAPDTCDCTTASPSDGWEGDHCQLPVCDPVCQHGGVCVAADTCDCSQTAFFGPQCQYGVPIVSFVKSIGDSAVDKKRAIKGLHVAIFGANFGATSIGVFATVGGFPCTHLTVVSDREIRCYVNGQGANVMTIVTVQGVSSTGNPSNNLFAEFRFDFPNVVSHNNELTCLPPFGNEDILNPEYCNCWSGAAPSSKLSTDCDVHTKCAARIASGAASAQHIAIRPEHTFKDDKLILRQVQPIVKNRRDTIIQFAVPSLASYKPATPIATLGASTCFYPGNLWEKKLNNLDCLDEYYLVLPWSQNEFCGFVEDLNPIHDTHSLRVYKTNLITTYTETFGVNSDGIPIFRKVSNTFLISVSFTKRVVVYTQSQVGVFIEDPLEDSFLTATITGDALYDVSTKNAIITFSTTVLWPYQLAESQLVGEWIRASGQAGNISAIAVLSSEQSGDSVCDRSQDTTCEQNWILTINTQPDTDIAAVCNLAGSLKFNTTELLCRDLSGALPELCPTHPFTDFTIRIGKTDLCDNGPAADASKGLTHILESFYDQEYTLPQTVFQTGDMIYFRVAVINPQATIDAIKINKLVVSSEDLSDSVTLWDVTDPLVYVSETNVTQEVGSLVQPGATGYLGFHFRLLRNALDVIGTLSSASAADAQRQLIVEATVDIWYHGNQKRATTRVVAGPLPAVTHATIAVYNYERADDDVIANNNNAVEGDDYSLWQSSASSSVASLVLVALLALFSLF